MNPWVAFTLVAVGVVLVLAMVMVITSWDLRRRRRGMIRISSESRLDDARVPFAMRPPSDPRWDELVRLAFTPGAALGDAQMEVHAVGELRCPSGQLVACDPLVFPDTAAFAQRIPPGQHRVDLAVARFATDARIAFARLVIEEVSPDRWEMAILSGQNPAVLRHGECFGYGVDSGTGAFFDASARPALLTQLADDEQSELIVEQQWQTSPSGSWRHKIHVLPLNDAAAPSVALFSSGWGDGIYETAVGFVADRVVCVVTSFQVASLPERVPSA